jgi:osmotically-inducible protein OsmY
MLAPNRILIGLLVLVPLLHGCPAAVVGGVAATAVVADDRRTTGVYLEDQNIELKAAKAIGDRYGSNNQVHVSATSFNRYVLLTGQVPSEEMKKDVGVLALGIENVRNVQNEVTIGPPTSFSQRTTDSYITTKVKTRFTTDAKGAFQVNHVKVVTEQDVVFLMGLVSRKEADAATELARTTSGVTKVVRVFELMD